MPSTILLHLFSFVLLLAVFGYNTASAQSPAQPSPGLIEPPKPVITEEADRDSAIYVPGYVPAPPGQLAPAATAATAFSFYAYPDTKLSLTYNGGMQFFGGNASGLFLWVGDQVYGPSRIPAGRTHLAYTLIGSSVSGDGSLAAPWLVTTTVGAGDTGVQLQSVLRYLNGSDTIDLQTTVANQSSVEQTVSLFHAGDLYLQFPNNRADYGYGTYRAATQGIGGTTSTGDYAFLFEPISPRASAYQEASYYTIWSAIGSTTRGPGFDNTFRTDYHDAGAGLQWTFTIPASQNRVVNHRLRLEDVDLRAFSPAIDAPNIQNWGEATPLSRRRFVETFGGGGTCPETGECRLDPAAELWYQNNFANVGSGGHCYGMSVMSSLFYRGIYAASTYDVAATVPFSLTRPNMPLEEQISVYHTFQADSAIGAYLTAQRSSLSPNDVLARIRATLAINNLDPYIVAIYGQVYTRVDNVLWVIPRWDWVTGGHALVPYSIVDVDDNVHRVYVYDSNHEGDMDRYIEFNTQNNTWQYAMGSGTRPIGLPGPADTWAGDSTNRHITFVPMSKHTGQKPQLPYRTTASNVWLAADTNWQGNIVIEDIAGNRLGMVEGNLVNEIPGGVPVIPMNSTPQPGAPSYYVPPGDYRILLESMDTEPVESQLSYMGPGFAFSAGSIDLAASSQDTITIGSQSPSRAFASITAGSDINLSYASNDAGKDVTLSYIYSLTQNSTAGRTVNLIGVEVGAGNGINTALDTTSGLVNLNATGDSPRSYDVQVLTQNDSISETASVFTYFNLTVVPNTTHQLDLSPLAAGDVVSLTVFDANGAVIDSQVIVNSHLVTAAISGNGTGTLTSSPPGIDCGAQCVAAYPQDTMLALTATPETGSSFAGWEGDCTGSDPVCQLPVDAAKAVTATFSLNSYAVDVTKSGNGAGTVTAIPAGIDCGETCSGSYLYGTQVTLTASANVGSSFTGWSGACTGSDPVCQLPVDAAKAVTASFALNTYTLTVTKDGEGEGTVVSAPGGVDCGSSCTASFLYGTQLVLTATAGDLSRFAGWSGACGSEEPVCQLEIGIANTVTAIFTKGPTLYLPAIKR